MKILALGDLVGESGLEKLQKDLTNLQEAENIDFTIVNAENVASGSGITTKIFNELNKLDIDVITMGDHTWGKKDIFSFIDNPKIIRPANYSAGVLGHGYTIIEKEGTKIAVISMIGRTFMSSLSENPFLCIDRIINKIQADISILDFHAEATAEKIAMGYYVDGRVSAMFGTHTHVQTADEKILEKGTGYITDVGMTGPEKAVIGMDKKVALKRFLTSIPERYKLGEGECTINGVIFNIDVETGRTNDIYRISV